MRIQLIVKIDGLRNGERWPAGGGLIDLPASERATAEPVIERATLAPTQPKRRKGK
jgi:hypothetical protein